MTSGERNWSSTTGAILMVSLMLFSTWIQVIDNETTLDEAPVARFLTASDTLSTDTQTNSSQSNNNYGSAQNLLIGDYPIYTNARMLANVPLTLSDGGVLPTTAVVSNAILELRCQKLSVLDAGDTVLYPARLLTDFDEANATHNISDTGSPWNASGADALGIDRGHWEPGEFVAIASNNQYRVLSLNLTALVQEALRNGDTNMSIVISGVGMPVVCASSEHPSSVRRPSIDFEYTVGIAPAQGSVQIEGPEDGVILSDASNLLIMPDYNPTISWENLSSSHIEIQFSSGEDFRSAEDETRVWNSRDNSGDFSMSNEEFYTPANEADLVNGTWVHFRMRSMNNSILGPWVQGFFGLTGEIGTLNGQGQAEILLRNDSVNLGFGTVHDTWVMDGNTSYNGNDDYRLRIGHSNDSTEGNMHALIRVNMEQVPIHDNVTIHEASLNLRRTDRTGDPLISAWLMNSNTGHVFSELDYVNRSNGVTWNYGGIDEIAGQSILGTVPANQTGSATLSFDATSFVQEYLHNGHIGDMDFIILAEGLAGEEFEMASGDEPFSYRPHLDITYSWGDGVATSSAANVTPMGSAAWDVVNWELQGTTTPTLTWDPSVATQSNGDPAEVIIELTDTFGESEIERADSRSHSGFDLANGEFEIPTNWNLNWGHSYDWRLSMVEDDEQSPWLVTGLLVSEINSTSLGGGEHELRYEHGNGTSQSLEEMPYCGDLTLEGGAASNMNLDGQDLTASDNQVVLVGCDLSSHAMPDGLAIVSATMRLRTLSTSGIGSFAIPMTMYESSAHDWKEGYATWNTTDSVTLWNAPGASGNERVQALDTTDIDADNTWYEWNVTAAVQSAMRTDSQVDFILTSDSWNAVSFYDRGSSSVPELVIIYTNGSNAAPNVPIDLAPGNGDWILSGDYTFAVDQTPTLSWNETGATAANAWQVQVDGDSGFSSTALLTFSSWIDTSSFSGSSFTFANDLSAGEEFHWRARGISASGQIGLWTAGTSFVIPDLDVTQIDSSTYQVDMGHGDILSDGSMPLFTDTWISWTSAGLNDTHADDDTLFISGWSSVLIEIPIDGPGALPHPSGARLVGAAIDFQVVTNNSSAPTIAIHETLKDWNESATGRTYNGSTNWSSLGGYGLLDRSDWVDIAFEPASSSRMNLDITEIVQAAIDRGDDSVGLMLSVEQFSTDQIVLASTETQFDANEPEIQLKWASGTGTTPSQAATIVSPANGDILWDFPSMSAEDTPLYSWSHTAASNVTDWRLFGYLTNDGPWGGITVLDSRTCGSACIFDMTNMTASTPSIALDHDEGYSWTIQPIQDGMYGPRSPIENFIVPNDIGDAINSTDYWASMANGNAYSATGSYDVTQGAYIDSCNPNSAYGNTANSLSIGASSGGPACTNAGHESRSLLRFDVSNVPIMDNNPWQVIEAHVEMYRAAGSSNYNTGISVSNVHCNWAEGSVTWNSCATNNSWQSSGANGANDADMPISVTDVSSNGWYSWNVTSLMQYARSSGSDMLNLLFASEDPNLYARHSFFQEHTTGFGSECCRPVLNITYRAGTQSLTTAPSWDSSLTTNSPFTAWDANALRPTPEDPLAALWNHPAASNIDAWQIQYATNDRFTIDTAIFDSSDSATWGGNISWDLTNLTMHVPAITAQGDHWNHLRVRAMQDGVYSNWSASFQARVPDSQGSDDGAGNYTVTMQRGAVFEDTGLLPTIPDSYVTSNTFGQTTNYGSSTTIAVGLDPADSAHDAVGLVSVDLAEYPYPATMLPTSVTLRMYVVSVTGNGAHSIAIHDCGGFTESTVSWNNYNPNTQCNSTASSSMTSTSTTSGVWYEWDVTGIARTAWAGNGVMNMGLQTGWGGTVYFNSAEGSGDYAPELVVDYVDNPNNASSPAQVSLISPEQLEVVYSVNQYTLGIEPRPVLSWNTLGDATGYVLILSNASGSQTYKSWDSNTNSGFNLGSTAATASTWTPDFDMATGEIYTWSVQALNSSVPGPRSVPWTFGIGDPTITYEGNHVYSIEIQEGSDVEALGHVPIWDTYMSEGAVDTAHGADDTLHIGTGCESVAANRCYGLYEIDMGQMGPLGQLPVNTHSAQLSIYVDQISQLNLANYMDLTAYQVINSNYEESGATWNSAATGTNWSAAGLQSGTDYIATPLDTVRVMSSFVGGWLHFDVGGAMTTMNGTVSIVIMGVANAGHMLIDVKTSESVSSSKPMLHFNYTLVDSISLTGPTTTDADTSVQFSGSLLDAGSNTLTGDVIWACSDGTIDANGYFTPDHSGIVAITASYGQVVETLNLTVTAGVPTILVVVPIAISLTADEIFDMSMLEVLDANGNVVPGEVITMTITNGSFSQGVTYNPTSMDYSVTTPAGAISWLPWATGTQWMNVTWGSQSASIEITVNSGVPSYFIITGDSMVEAGNTTSLDIDIYDQKGNMKDRSTSGTLTWGAVNGAMDNATGAFTGDLIGTWNIWVDSDLGIHSERSIDVTYGDIDELEVTAVGPSGTIIVTSSPTMDSIALTADDSVTLSVIRIDVQGNREPFDLPLSGWTWLNGVVNAGSPTTWDAADQGTSWVKATLEGYDVVVPMTVDHGLPDSIEIRSTSLTLVSGQDTGTLSVFASDADGNEWSVSGTWSTAASSASDWLEDQGHIAVFEAVTVGDWTINVYHEYSDPGVGTLSISTSETFTVLPGILNEISLAANVVITADDTYDLSPDARDVHDNDLPEDSLQWLQWDSTTEIAPTVCSLANPGWQEITLAMRDANYVWGDNDNTMIGQYTICAFGSNNVQSMSVINVTVGQVANVWHKAYSTFTEESADDPTRSQISDHTDTQITAGDFPIVEIWVKDADGNEYQLDGVDWGSNSANIIPADSNQFLEIGNYRFIGLTDQDYELTYSAGSCSTCSGIWNVAVDYGPLFRIEATASSPGAIPGTTINVEQQSLVTISIEGFDQHGNSVPVSINEKFDDISDSLNIWSEDTNQTSAEVYMLNGGVNKITVCAIDNVDAKACDQVQISVDGTLTGWFEATAPLSWILLASVVALLLGVVLVVIVLMRRGDRDEEYDEDFFEDDDDYIAPATSPTTESNSEPEPQEEYSTEEDPNYRVDEDGTEWWQDDEGAWWYREPDMDDWAEWTE